MNINIPKNKIFTFLHQNLILIISILLVTHLTGFYSNIYKIFKRDYEQRMTKAYGFCERESYGFVKKSYEITKSERLQIFNFEDQLWPNVNGLFNIVNKPIDKNYAVLLNLKNLPKKLDKQNMVSYRGFKFNLNKSNILLEDSNCYLIKYD